MKLKSKMWTQNIIALNISQNVAVILKLCMLSHSKKNYIYPVKFYIYVHIYHHLQMMNNYNVIRAFLRQPTHIMTSQMNTCPTWYLKFLNPGMISHCRDIICFILTFEILTCKYFQQSDIIKRPTFVFKFVRH